MSLLRSLIRIYSLWTLCCSRLSLTNMDGHLEVVSKLFELMQLWKWAQSCCNKFLENFKYKIQLTVPYTCFFRTELISLTLFELSDVRPHRLRVKVEISIFFLEILTLQKLCNGTLSVKLLLWYVIETILTEVGKKRMSSFPETP